MLLENVRSLDEAVEEVREERQAKEAAKLRARSADRRERAELKAISRQGGMLARARGGRQVPALTAAGDGPSASEPALAADADATSQAGRSALEPASSPSALEAGRRPRAAVGSSSTGSLGDSSYLGSGSSSSSSYRSSTIDLTADDDTLSMPKLDSLERKLRAIEQQLG